MIFRLLGLLNTNISNDTNIFSRGSYSVFNTHTDLTLFFYTHTDRTDLTDLCSRRGAHWGLEHEIFLNTNNANDTNNYLHADLALYLKRTRIARMLVRVGTLT